MNERPCVVWGDEYHQFALKHFDPQNQAVARENRMISVALVQFLELLSIAFGRDGKKAAEAWAAGLSCKFFGANSSAETNEFAAKLIGKHRVMYFGGGPQQDFDITDEFMGNNKGGHVHFNEKLQHVYESSFF